MIVPTQAPEEDTLAEAQEDTREVAVAVASATVVERSATLRVTALVLELAVEVEVMLLEEALSEEIRKLGKYKVYILMSARVLMIVIVVPPQLYLWWCGPLIS